MGYKHNDTCLAKVGDDEPIFVLRAQDDFMPTVLGVWISMARRNQVPEAKIQKANNLLSAVYTWREKHPHKVPD